MELPFSRNNRSALDVACQAAQEAGALLVEHANEEREFTFKEGRANIVTDVDVLVENRIVARILEEFPEHNVLSEETAAIKTDSDYTWVIDPLDGTNNYVHGVPFYCVAISLTLGDEILLGVTYDPWLQELFTAQKGGGAFLNGQPISVSQRTELSGSFVGFDLGYDMEAAGRLMKGIEKSWSQTSGIRIMGSAVLGLTYVACGRLDIYVHAFLYPWDVAGGILLVREAGGKVTDWDGQPASIYGREVLAGNRSIHRQFTKVMSGEAQLGLPWVA